MPKSYHAMCREALARHAGLSRGSGQREELELLKLYEVIFDEQMIALPRTAVEIEPAQNEVGQESPRDRRALMPTVVEMKDLFVQLVEGVERRCPESLADAAMIRDLCRREVIDFAAALEAVAEGDQVALEDMAADADVNTDSFLILIRESLRPFVLCAALERMTSDWREIEGELAEPECPTCGSEPSLLEEAQGRPPTRLLLCSFCGTLWPTRRGMCLFCDNHNPSRLTSMESGSATGARADICEACKMYVKVLPRSESDRGNPISLYIDSLLTQYLDRMAEEEGYEASAGEIFSLF